MLLITNKVFSLSLSLVFKQQSEEKYSHYDKKMKVYDIPTGNDISIFGMEGLYQ